mmetsp:Transcript_4972/g.6749  ORF Transcript_4972/g.6749 Transcript_4972/m.6749 type:complete len:234 (+) Transcript_4972:163-864(+)
MKSVIIHRNSLDTNVHFIHKTSFVVTTIYISSSDGGSNLSIHRLRYKVQTKLTKWLKRVFVFACTIKMSNGCKVGAAERELPGCPNGTTPCRARTFVASVPIICSAPKIVKKIPSKLRTTPIEAARRIIFAETILLVDLRTSRRPNRLLPQVQKIEKIESTIPVPANKNNPPLLAMADPLFSNTDFAKIRVTLETTVRIICAHQLNQLDRRKALEARSISTSTLFFRDDDVSK